MRDHFLFVPRKIFFIFFEAQRNIDDVLIIIQNKITHNNKKYFFVDNFFYF